MASTRRTPKDDSPRRPTAPTLEGDERRMIALAVDCAEKQMREGTASSQIISHYLKLGSSREQLEQERLRNENLMLEAKREAMASAARVETMYEEALQAMRSYSGQDPVDPFDS